MDIDEKGNIVGHRICETVINVDRRMSYTSVKKILVDKDIFYSPYQSKKEFAMLIRDLLDTIANSYLK